MRPSFFIGDCCRNSFLIADTQEVMLTEVEKANFAKEHLAGFSADSCLFIQRSSIADLRLEVYEQNGTKSDSCGNGMMLLAHQFSLANGSIETAGGLFKVFCTSDQVGFSISFPTLPVRKYEGAEGFLYVEAGEPHLVKIVDDIESIDIQALGERFQFLFPRGINVNLLQKVNDTKYRIRTFERGVNHATESCGTGSLSAFIAIMELYPFGRGTMLELQSSGGSHWVSESNTTFFLQTTRSSCRIRPVEISSL
jgi:diaminopimelate epimerase